MMKKFIIFIFISLILVLPVLSFAADPIVPCDGTVYKPCDFDSFMTLINNVINFLVKIIALPIAAIMFTYAGFLMVTAGEEAAGARTKAKGIFMNALIGLLLAATCWLIVHSLLKVMGYKGGWIGL